MTFKKRALEASPTGIWFRWNKKNGYSIAALLPLVEGAGLADRPREGIMLYSFASPQAEEVYREVDSSRGSVEAVFVAGGPHPSARPEEALRRFDFVVIGEGEETLPELISVIKGGDDPAGVKGIGYRQDGIARLTLPREDVDLDLYPPFQPPIFSPIEITRGCPWGCAYCQTPRLFGRRIRHRSISKILEYARFYSDLRFTSPNALAYGSDGLHPRIDKVEQLLSSLSELDKPIYFGTFPSEVRPDFVTEEAIDLIVRHCRNRHLSIGGQSGSDRILKMIGRGHDVEAIRRACDLSLDGGLVPNLDLIVGLPGETAEDQRMTLDLAREVVGGGGRIRAHHFIPLPGTPLEDEEPADLAAEVAKEMGELALRGKATGRWGSSDQM
ncbi:TIGR04013 family B12-binding domain/radical SAM domain-containing protein [Candidatus Methanocrinis natronophilus]|uniref:TIGR04013 family B12-binding domain/radical SAM domain-containing protein n=1 Tax=Candidatus Methanocrinis natronophilus TaxID=3033396 RepID=A0ABT5X6U5_9EURY|nr:TIGR04013 family B12-binding domain/radical SAM domain-containing protein [Candidatus Methanocrinis natronophilus]MDF0590407.1 TIGR04013 family B12-binding domain/radical SAM domain-containing protein [Candidatus Methanocrinis natronophilus]